MDIKKLQRKEYYENNKERIKEKNKQYYHDNKAVRQEYNRNYWATHGQKYVEQRKTTIDHKAKYQNLKQYHKEYNIINSEKISENYYKINVIKSVRIITDINALKFIRNTLKIIII